MLFNRKIRKNTKKILDKFQGLNGFPTEIGLNNLENRINWVEKTLRKIPVNSTILDAGAGECQYKKYCSHLNYTSQDFAEYDGKGNEIGIQTQSWDNSKIDIISDIVSIPVEDSSYDAVLCTEVLEHVIDPVSALNELDRILKKGGYLIITAPFSSLTHFAPYHFFTGFSKFFYEEFTKKKGYEILELNPNGNYFDYLAQELRRLESIYNLYSNEPFKDEIKQSIDILLYNLNKVGFNENKSSELLCFGFHFLAQKL